ncbi:MAG: DUF4440 domain-containing protein [Candidatus Methylacidiphilales bacterium]|nr:DUF4440 domain-containing protein [Candidatus Methylacidiphilales bacterium]
MIRRHNYLALLTAILLGVLISFAPNTLRAGSGDDKSVLNAANNWAAAIGGRNPDTIAALYDPGAVLWATFSTTRYSTPGQIHSYFVNLTKRKDLKATFTSHLIRIHGDVAIDTGYYYFSFTENGKTVKVPARYSFGYKRTAKGWKIIEHHSSIVPPGSKE